MMFTASTADTCMCFCLRSSSTREGSCRPHMSHTSDACPVSDDISQQPPIAYSQLSNTAAALLSAACTHQTFNLCYPSVWHTRKPSYRWQTRSTQKHVKNCYNLTCLKCCRWQYWSIFIRLAVGPRESCEIPRNSLKIQTYRVRGHPKLSILVPIESAYVLSY